MASDDYVDVELEASADPDALRDRALDVLTAGVDDYAPADGNLEVLVLDATAEMAADREAMLVDVSRGIFRVYAREVIGLQPLEAIPAQASTEWTMRDATGGYAIPEGTRVAIGDVAFETVDSVTVPVGQSVLPDVTVQALDAGAAGNDLSGDVILLDSLAFVATVALNAPTHSGQDAEAEDEFEGRTSRELRHLGRPTLPEDFADRALDVAVIGRALAIDGYDADLDTEDNARTITVAVAGTDGQPVDEAVRDALAVSLAAQREANWNVYVIDPTYTTINVAATVTVWSAFVTADVLDAAEAALAALLNPAAWGTPPVGDAQTWHDEPVVYLSEVSAALNAVEGVRRVATLDVNGVTDLDGNVALAGRAGLPEAGTIAVTEAS